MPSIRIYGTELAETENTPKPSVVKTYGLEKECGMTLCERGRTGITLTYEGLKLYPHFQRICNEYEVLTAIGLGECQHSQ